MSADLKDAIVLISSKTKGSDHFGSGFVIWRDGESAYLLTCAHVINDVGAEAVLVNGQPAAVIASDEGFDLAVLKATSAASLPGALPLSTTARTGLAFRAAGFYRPDQKANQCQELDGMLEKEDGRWSAQFKRAIPAWRVKIEGEEYGLQRGNSGGPVLDKSSGRVIGVIAISESTGQKGIAVSLAALPLIWTEMPAGLFSESAPPRLQPTAQAAPARINLKTEVPAFEAIAAQQDAATRLICICAPSESGKTHLLKEYRRIASAYRLEQVFFECKAQLSIDKCLNDIVIRFGLKHFPLYAQFRKSGCPATLSRAKEEKWYQDLTWEFFTDLGNYAAAPRLAIFFDTYENADPAFKKWLAEAFLPHLRGYPLIVVIAGRSEVEPKPVWQAEQLYFNLQNYTIRDYQDYCAAHQVNLPDKILQIVYTAANGRPAGFIKVIQSQMAGGGL